MQVGDIVVLKSGGPRMTVNAVFETLMGKCVKVVWFGPGEVMQAQNLAVEAVEEVEPKAVTVQ